MEFLEEIHGTSIPNAHIASGSPTDDTATTLHEAHLKGDTRGGLLISPRQSRLCFVYVIEFDASVYDLDCKPLSVCTERGRTAVIRG